MLDLQIDHKNRILLKNIIYWMNDDLYMMNLVSFRRRKLSANEFEILKDIHQHLVDGRRMNESCRDFYQDLLKEKQVMDEDTLGQVDHFLQGRMTDDNLCSRLDSIVVNLTYECNFKCSYCYQDGFHDNNESITLEDVDHMIAFIRDHNKASSHDYLLDCLTISGGEPLLEKNLPVLNYMIEQFRPLVKTIELYTNGVNLHMYRSKVDYDLIDKFQVSLDGMDPIIRELNSYAGGGFSTILDGILDLVKLEKDITVVTLLTKGFLDQVDDMLAIERVQDILSYQGLKWQISLISEFKPDSVVHPNYYSVDEMIDLRKRVIDKTQKYKMTVDTVNLSFLAQAMLRGLNEKITPAIHRCNVHDKIPATFGPKGHISWCVSSSRPEGLIGNYRRGQGLDMEKLRKIQKRTIFQFEECRTCDFKYVCSGGCLLNSMSDLSKKACGGFKNERVMDRLEELLY